MQNRFFEYKVSGSACRLQLRGQWTLQSLGQIADDLASASFKEIESVTLDGSALEALDTAGAMLLLDWARRVGGKNKESETLNFKTAHRNILTLVQELESQAPAPPKPSPPLLASLGKGVVDMGSNLLSLLHLFGLLVATVLGAFFDVRRLRFREFVVQLELTCLRALPVIILVSMLIGLVVTYLFADQIEKYGANIFIVDGITIGMCRELSPMLVAVIVAGRSGSSFTAQIGSMKLTEEIDAIKILGLSPIEVLVLPRVLALMLAMPLLVFVSDAASICSGMWLANLQLGITPSAFVDRIEAIAPIKALWIGLVKAPVFAAFIALIGCRMGFIVENNARSVGLHTTSTVVQSIVAVILLDAAFAILFMELGL